MLKVKNTDNTTGIEYESDVPQFIPALYAVYKKNRWAGFFAFNVPLGGGRVEFDNGNARTIQAAEAIPVPTTAMKLEAESFGLAFTLGAAHQFNDWLSLSLAARYINAKRAQEATINKALPAFDASIDVEQDASGLGGVLGVDFFPKDWLTIGLTYQSRISLDYDIEHKSGTNPVGTNILNAAGLVDGTSVRSDLPALLGAGADVRVSDRLRWEVSFRYYFNRDADLGKASDGSDLADKISDSIEFGVAVEYALLPKLKGSLGYLYSATGGNADYMTPELPELNANTFAGGFAWEVVRDLDLQFAGGMATYAGQTDSAGRFSYDRNVPFLAFGVEYTF